MSQLDINQMMSLVFQRKLMRDQMQQQQGLLDEQQRELKLKSDLAKLENEREQRKDAAFEHSLMFNAMQQAGVPTNPDTTPLGPDAFTDQGAIMDVMNTPEFQLQRAVAAGAPLDASLGFLGLDIDEVATALRDQSNTGLGAREQATVNLQGSGMAVEWLKTLPSAMRHMDPAAVGTFLQQVASAESLPEAMALLDQIPDTIGEIDASLKWAGFKLDEQQNWLAYNASRLQSAAAQAGVSAERITATMGGLRDAANALEALAGRHIESVDKGDTKASVILEEAMTSAFRIMERAKYQLGMDNFMFQAVPPSQGGESGFFMSHPRPVEQIPVGLHQITDMDTYQYWLNSPGMEEFKARDAAGEKPNQLSREMEAVLAEKFPNPNALRADAFGGGLMRHPAGGMPVGGHLLGGGVTSGRSKTLSQRIDLWADALMGGPTTAEAYWNSAMGSSRAAEKTTARPVREAVEVETAQQPAKTTASTTTAKPKDVATALGEMRRKGLIERGFGGVAELGEFVAQGAESLMDTVQGRGPIIDTRARPATGEFRRRINQNDKVLEFAEEVYLLNRPDITPWLSRDQLINLVDLPEAELVALVNENVVKPWNDYITANAQPTELVQRPFTVEDVRSPRRRAADKKIKASQATTNERAAQIRELARRGDGTVPATRRGRLERNPQTTIRFTDIQNAPFNPRAAELAGDTPRPWAVLGIPRDQWVRMVLESFGRGGSQSALAPELLQYEDLGEAGKEARAQQIAAALQQRVQ